jgi:hypothetical protein
MSLLLQVERPSKSQDKFLRKLVNTKEKIVTSFNFDKDLHKEIKQYAFDHDLTVTELVHKALDAYINNGKQRQGENKTNHKEIVNTLAQAIESLIEVSNKLDKLE